MLNADTLEQFVDATGDCWIWKLAPQPDGYGRKTFRVAGVKKQFQAHRWVWEMLVGPIPEDLQLDHLCRVRACVNPDHLEPVTLKENLWRGRSRFNKQGQKLCKRGHDLNDSYQYGASSRNCRQCASIRHAERRDRT